MAQNTVNSLDREQEAFDAALPDLLQSHGGEFVVFKDRHPAGFFQSFAEAYSTAIERFGLDASFLVSEVKPPDRSSSSLSWDLGVL